MKLKIFALLILIPLLFLVGFGTYILFNNVSSNGNIKSTNTNPPKTYPVLKDKTLKQPNRNDCKANDSYQEYSADNGTDGKFLTFDVTKPFRQGYDQLSLNYLNDFLENKKTISNFDSMKIEQSQPQYSITRALDSCEGGYVQQLEDVTNKVNFRMGQIEKIREVIVGEYTQPESGHLAFVSIAKRGDHVMMYKQRLIDSKLIDTYRTECKKEDKFDMDCYNKKLISEEYRNLLLKEVEKTYTTFLFE
ncbi:MAG: hypothetical protein ACRCXZ_06635 [Patescibacteria group bacterium]